MFKKDNTISNCETCNVGFIIMGHQPVGKVQCVQRVVTIQIFSILNS